MKHCSLEFLSQELNVFTLMFFKAADTLTLHEWCFSNWTLIWIVAGDETRQRVKFTDERVCKSHLLNCCPHDILSGTVSTQEKKERWIATHFGPYGRMTVWPTALCDFISADGSWRVHENPWPGPSCRLWDRLQGEGSVLWAWCKLFFYFEN